MSPLTQLQQNPVLGKVPASQLEWLLEKGEVINLQEGEYLFRANQPIEYFFVIFEGKFEVFAWQAGQRRDVFTLDPGDLSGALPYSRGKISIADAVSSGPSTVFRLKKEWLRDMICDHYELTEALVHQMTDRVREMGKMQLVNEKMVSLGKLSAGLAHELNNPAAAIVRSSDALRKHLSHTPERFKKVMTIEANDRQVDEVNLIIFEKLRTPPPNLPLLERANLEDDLLSWLEDHEVGNAYDIAPVLMEFGFQTADLDRLNNALNGKHLDPVVNWVCNNLVTEKIVSEIREASQRIGYLVDSIKSYSHMDRGANKTRAAIGDGLRNTLTLLNHKLKVKNIQTGLDIPGSLPPIPIFPGEINQVWTNLIDNAIDAMEAGGRLEITCEVNGKWLKTSIADNGPGIPEDIIDNIFDPFFTTKEVGKGTGLGLDIVRKIVNAHKGEIKVESRPGRTEFIVCLPLHENA
jgi:signal transduction histidine kinase